MAGPVPLDPRAQAITQAAIARGVDPAAALSIASVEGGFNGSIGDNGTSFGPFQLHVNGALPSQYNSNPQAADAFANSQAGINYAMDAIAKIAKGLHGTAAVSAISRLFERPADPSAEIAKASGRYGDFAGGNGGQFTAMPYQAPGATGSASSRGLQGIQPQPQVGATVSPIQQMAKTLLTQQMAQIQPIGQPAAGGTARTGGIVQLQPQQPQGNGILDMALQRMQGQAAQQAFGATPSSQTNVTGPGAQAAGTGNAIVHTAMSQIGIPYQYGGQAKLGGHTDCSGLAQAVLGANGINIPRTTYEQWKVGTPVSMKNLQPGDLVFFHMGSDGPNHVGIYKGNGQFIEDPHTGAAVKTESLATYPGFVGARRYTQ